MLEVEINKVFYKPEKLRSIEKILGDIATLDQEETELKKLITNDEIWMGWK